MKLLEIKRYLRNGPYAWPGGYPMYFVTIEGDVLSFATVRKHWRDVCEAHIVKGCRLNGWRIEDVNVNWEDPELYCDVSDERIPSAYAEPEDE